MPAKAHRTHWFAIAAVVTIVGVALAFGAAAVTVLAVRSVTVATAPRASGHNSPRDDTVTSPDRPGAPRSEIPTPTSPNPQSVDGLDALAVEALAALQDQSIEEQVEFCAYIVTDGATLSTAPIQRGDKDGCSILEPKSGEVVASFHTHGNHDPGYWSEVPSETDVDGDMADGIPGYVGTPGGRVWVTDPNDGSVEVLCGVGCIPADPNYRAEDTEPFDDEMTYEQLVAYLSQ